MAKKTNTNLERVSINIPSSIVKKVKDYANDLGINYTSAYIVLLNQALDQKDMLRNMPLMFSMVNDIKHLTNNDGYENINDIDK